MLKIILSIIQDCIGSIGITQASIVSAVCDNTGDDSADAQVKIKRLINNVGQDFCMLTNWPFLREDISFTINGAGGWEYSGASYIPQTFRQVQGARIVGNSDEWFPLVEISVRHRDNSWINPGNNEGRPDAFCISRIESNYWQIQFNRKPDQQYTVELEIEKKWVALTDSNTTLITDEYLTAFCHFVSMHRFLQQGDTENYMLYKSEWFNPSAPNDTILGRIMKSLNGPVKKKQVIPKESFLMPFGKRTSDYGRYK